MITEKQKMLAGEFYLANDSELLKERAHAASVLFEMQGFPPSRRSDKDVLFRKLLGTTGSAFVIERGFHCDYGYNIHLGENFFANINCTILDCAEVRIGDNVLIGPGVGIFTAAHPVDAATRSAGWEFASPVTIGNNVWIGGNVVILPNVSIGDNSIIGAGSVVSKSIPANVIAVGNPCRVMKEIEPMTS